MTVEPGDIVFLHTGWGRLWDEDPDRYAASEPGLDESAGRWLTDRRVAVIGADNWAVERVVLDRGPEAPPSPVHQETIARNGTYLVENLRLAELAADGVTTFLAMIAPRPSARRHRVDGESRRARLSRLRFSGAGRAPRCAPRRARQPDLEEDPLQRVGQAGEPEAGRDRKAARARDVRDALVHRALRDGRPRRRGARVAGGDDGGICLECGPVGEDRLPPVEPLERRHRGDAAGPSAATRPTSIVGVVPVARACATTPARGAGIP